MLAYTGIILIIINLIFSIYGFKNPLIIEKYNFEVRSILKRKEFYRIITSGFLHVNWLHLVFNMISLYSFSQFLEFQLGALNMLLIYFSGMIGGNILALFIHKNHDDYNAIGASGAISGLIFASIALFPGIEIGIFVIPIDLPSWLFGVAFIFISIFGIKSQKDNVCHEAHLGGALIGMIVAIFIQPLSLKYNLFSILLISIPTFLFLIYIVKNPSFLLFESFNHQQHQRYFDIDHQYNDKKVNKQKELDALLDKINAKGIESLSKFEKQRLEELSR